MRVRSSASSRNCEVIAIIPGVDSETATSEGLPNRAFIRTVVAVDVCLDPGVARVGEGRVARLESHRIHEEVQEDNVALFATEREYIASVNVALHESLTDVRGIRLRVGRETELLNQARVDVVQHVRPDFPNVMLLVEGGNGGVLERVRGHGGGIGTAPQTTLTVQNVLTHDVILNGSRLLLGPSIYRGQKCVRVHKKDTYSAKASDQPSPIPRASIVWRQRPVPPPVILLEMPWPY